MSNLIYLPLQVDESPLLCSYQFGSSQSKFTQWPNYVDVGEDNTQTAGLETHMGYLPTNDNVDSEF